MARLSRLLAGRFFPAPPDSVRRAALSSLWELLARDAGHIAAGVYPLATLAPESPLRHAARYVRILLDGAAVARRGARGDSRDFDPEVRAQLAELPAYYRRNYHFQTDGYLSEASAELYDHQVQILFRGAADVMRRLVLAPLKHFAGGGDGRGLRILELGAGCGSATRFTALALPRAEITCLDLSDPYLQVARRRPQLRRRVNFHRGDAAALDFRAQCFDAVYSVFLFHELPLATRRQVVRESLRVLRPGGFMAMVESLQRHDAGDLAPALEGFPERFHEPYYADYLRHPMEALFEEAGARELEVEKGFVSKCLIARAPGADQGSQRLPTASG